MKSENKILCLVGLTTGQFIERRKLNNNSIIYKLVSKIFIWRYSVTRIVEVGMNTVHATIFRPIKLTQIAHYVKYNEEKFIHPSIHLFICGATALFGP